MSQLPEAFLGHDLTGWTYTRGYASNQAFDHVSRLAADGSVVTVYGDLSWVIVACTGQQIEGDDPAIKTPSDLDLVVQKHCGGWAPAPIGYEPSGWKPIETAPKDRGFIAYRPDAGVFCAEWRLCEQHGNMTLWSEGGYSDLTDDMPTHWMPLPQPPQEGQG